MNSSSIFIASMPVDADISTNRLMGFPSGFTREQAYVQAAQISKQYNNKVMEETFRVHQAKNYDSFSIVRHKQALLGLVREYLANRGIKMVVPEDVVEQYFAYEFTTLWLWNEFIVSLEKGNRGMSFCESYCKKHRNQISTVFRKYPKITGFFISEIDLHHPNNKLMEYANPNNDYIDYESDGTVDAS